jgi:hypothetical protein
MTDGGRRKFRREGRVSGWQDWCPATTCSDVDSRSRATTRDLETTSQLEGKEGISKERQLVARLKESGQHFGFVLQLLHMSPTVWRS